MKHRHEAQLRLARLLIAVAATLVGRGRRSEWRREWEAELWVAAERGRPVMRDALGAFRHAFSARRYAASEGSAGGKINLHNRFSWLDFRLGMRMLAKYPGLSLVSVIGMAVATSIAAGVFSILAAMIGTRLPLPEGERVVVVRNAIATQPGHNQASLRDFVTWRDELGSVQDLAAFTTLRMNLLEAGVAVTPVRVVRMTASGFRIARTAPLIGRVLLDEDERNDVRVVVIGFDEWQHRFAADPDIVGRRIGLGSDEYTVVGVMPDGFRFPIDDYYWIPLVIGPTERARAEAIEVTITGRLMQGATLESAQSELTTIGTRMARAHPETHEHLRPRVLSYTRAFFDIDDPEQVWTVQLFRILFSLLLVVVAVNVAVLIYARTATRTGEIAVRTALGASRARVVTQLFAEALVLSGIAAVIGLTTAGVVLAKSYAVAERRLGELPFWVQPRLSAGTITYALVLAIVGAAIVGVVPALKATGRHLQLSLQQLAGRGAHMQLGRVWTALIIAQVAVAVAFLPFAVHLAEEMLGLAAEEVGYPAKEFVEASLNIEQTDAWHGTSVANNPTRDRRFRASAAELIRRLESDPAVAGLSLRVTGYERVEVAPIAKDKRRINVRTEGINYVEPDYFALYGMPILAGRGFVEADLGTEPTAVIVNEVYAENRFGTSAVLGRHLHFLREPDAAGGVEGGPWLEIVGVVQDLEVHASEPSEEVYLPTDVARLTPPVRLSIHVRVDPAMSFAPRLRETAARIDPMLQLDGIVSAGEQERRSRQFVRWTAIGVSAAMASVLLLSAAGVYAMMSFTVARRRREIGIRSALGANPQRVLSGIFAGASAQIASGIAFGLLGAFAVDRGTGRGPVNDGNLSALVLVAVVMTAVGLLAATEPARRALAVQPTEALREE